LDIIKGNYLSLKLLLKRFFNKLIVQQDRKLRKFNKSHIFRISLQLCHILRRAIFTWAFPLHELLKACMAFHAAGLFRLIISQEEPLLDGQYITVTRFKTGHEISLPERYVKRECDTKNVQNGREKKRTRGRERLRATRAKRCSERVEPKNDRCHDKIESVLLAVT